MANPSFNHVIVGFGLPLAAQSSDMFCPSIATAGLGRAINVGGATWADCSWSPLIYKTALLLSLYEFRPEALHLKINYENMSKFIFNIHSVTYMIPSRSRRLRRFLEPQMAAPSSGDRRSARDARLSAIESVVTERHLRSKRTGLSDRRRL